jgi:hypothetical protein
MVFFGRKEKPEDRRLLASMDTMNGTIIHQIDNGNIFIVARRKADPARANNTTLVFAY